MVNILRRIFPTTEEPVDFDAKRTSSDKLFWMDHPQGYIYRTRSFIESLIDKKESIKPGLYETFLVSGGFPLLSKTNWETDKILNLSDPVVSSIRSDFEYFWNSKEAYLSFDYLHKRGILLWGPPGTGKTSIVASTLEYIINDKKGIVLIPYSAKALLKAISSIREKDKDICILVVLEELDTLMSYDYEEDKTTFLSILDGQGQVNNIFFLATTNYPEKLEERIKNRPSRFDRVIKISHPNETMRENYFKLKIPKIDNDELNHWVNKTEGYSIAHLKEIVIQTQIYEIPFDDVIVRFEAMNTKISSSEFNSDSLGFTIGK